MLHRKAGTCVHGVVRSPSPIEGHESEEAKQVYNCIHICREDAFLSDIQVAQTLFSSRTRAEERGTQSHLGCYSMLPEEVIRRTIGGLSALKRG